jgi:hypothetical protein
MRSTRPRYCGFCSDMDLLVRHDPSPRFGEDAAHVQRRARDGLGMSSATFDHMLSNRVSSSESLPITLNDAVQYAS